MTTTQRRVGAVITMATTLLFAAGFAAQPVQAATKKATVAKKGSKTAWPTVAEASPEQLEAAKLVYFGHYDCELNKSVDIGEDPRHAGYVDVKHAKATYLMKPVLSSTGAVRLEDVKGQTLMVQIANKSMLLDVKQGHRLVDDCVSPRQHELIAQAARVKAAEAAASAAAAAAMPPASAASGAPDASAAPASGTAPAQVPDAASAVAASPAAASATAR